VLPLSVWWWFYLRPRIEAVYLGIQWSYRRACRHLRPLWGSLSRAALLPSRYRRSVPVTSACRTTALVDPKHYELITSPGVVAFLLSQRKVAFRISALHQYRIHTPSGYLLLLAWFPIVGRPLMPIDSRTFACSFMSWSRIPKNIQLKMLWRFLAAASYAQSKDYCSRTGDI